MVEVGSSAAPSARYRPSLALLTDLYELTMGYGFHKSGLAEREACFTLSFREHPFHSGYTVACGLADALDWIEHLRFDDEDRAFLGTLTGNDGRPLFDAGYLDRLRALRAEVTVDAVPEGTVVFPHEPLLRITGPLLIAQLLETALLCIINFQTLIATKAARVCRAAQADPVLEFGLRRAQGIDGALSASRAAFIGGCAATSNVLAGRLYGIPVRGTHAHSWVMAFPDELTSFEAYAASMPNNCTFLVDTYDTLRGVQHAVQIGRALRAAGHDLAGVRIDSGDLAYLSIESRKILDEAGFPAARITVSNDLDEHLIESLKHQEARVDLWGVGTKLVTAYEQAALGGVYKLSALRDEAGVWQHRMKLSAQAAKVSTPGVLQVRRYLRDPSGASSAVADCIYDELHPIARGATIVHPTDPTVRRTMDDAQPFEDLLVTVLDRGRRTMPDPTLMAIRERTQQQLALFHEGTKRLHNPHTYPVGFDAGLQARKLRLIEELRDGG